MSSSNERLFALHKSAVNMWPDAPYQETAGCLRRETTSFAVPQDAEVGKLGMEAERLVPKRSALSRVTERIKRRQFDQALRAARFPGYGPVRDRTRAAHPLGVSAAIVARRD